MHIPTQIANNSSHCNLIVLSAFQHIETHCADALSTLEVGPLVNNHLLRDATPTKDSTCSSMRHGDA